MDKPTGIPQDVRNSAREIATAHLRSLNITTGPNGAEVMIAVNAILTERERCAQLAEAHADIHAKGWAIELVGPLRRLADAIREGRQP